MEDNKRRTSLGRGLNALFGEAAAMETLSEGKSTRAPVVVPIDRVSPGRFQPRRKFDEEAIRNLVDSIRERGILQPILVRRHPKAADAYEIIAGERRWRAAQLASIHEVPVVIRDFSDREALEIALIENIQRQDLTALEEAEGYKRLIQEFQHSQEDLGRTVGKSRSHIANTLRLLALPDAVKAMVQDGVLSAGHARALLTADDPLTLAQEVVRRGLNVRQTEQLVRAVAEGRALGAKAAPPKDVDTIALERDLSSRIGLAVRITQQAKGGTLTIQYKNLDQLDSVLALLNRES